MTTGSHAAGVVRAKQNRAEKSSNFISIAQMLFNVPLILYSLWDFATPLHAPFIDRSFDHFTEQLPPKKTNETETNSDRRLTWQVIEDDGKSAFMASHRWAAKTSDDADSHHGESDREKCICLWRSSLAVWFLYSVLFRCRHAFSPPWARRSAG